MAKKVDYTYPLPPEKLHKRYDAVFEGFKCGLSSTIIGFPQSNRSAYLKFILRFDEEFLKEFISDEFKFIFIDETIYNSHQLLVSISFQLIAFGLLDTQISGELNESIHCSDDMLICLCLEKALGVLNSKQLKIVVVLYEIEGLVKLDPGVIQYLAKLLSIGRHPPKSFMHLLFIGGMTFWEGRSNSVWERLRGSMEENLCVFSLFDSEEMEYCRRRFEKLENIQIDEQIHEDSTKLSGGNYVLYRSLIHLSKDHFREVLRSKSDSSVDETVETLWKSLPILWRQNWNIAYLSSNELAKKMRVVINGEIQIAVLPPRSRMFESKIPNVLELTAQQKLIFDYFIQRQSQIISREEIAQVLWGKLWQEKYSDWAIDRSICDLKRKMKIGNSTIITLRNRGYKYVLE